MGLFRSPVPLSGGASSKGKLNRDSLITNGGNNNGDLSPPLDASLMVASSISGTANSGGNEKTGTTTTTTPTPNNTVTTTSSNNTTTLAPPMFHTINDHDRQLLKNLKGTFQPSPPGTIRRVSLNSDSLTDSAVRVPHLPLTTADIVVGGFPLVGPKTGEDTTDPSRTSNNNNNNNKINNKTNNNFKRFNQSFSVGVPSNKNVRMKGPLPSLVSPVQDGGGKKNGINIGRLSAIISPRRSIPRGQVLSSSEGSTNNRRSSLGGGLNNKSNKTSPESLIAALPLSPTNSTTSSKGKKNKWGDSEQSLSLEQTSPQQQQQQQRVGNVEDVTTPLSNNPKLQTLSSSLQSLASDSSSYIEELIEDDENDDGIAFGRSGTVSSDSFIEEIILEDDDYTPGIGFQNAHGRVAGMDPAANDIVIGPLSVSAAQGQQQRGVGTATITKRRRRVRFDEFDEVQMTLHMNDYTAQELKRSWYKREDYDGMIQSSRTLVQKEEVRKSQEQQQQQQQEQQQQQQERHSGEEASNQSQKESSIPSFPSPSMLWAALSSDLDTRGLESWSAAAAQQIRQTKEAAVEAVWNEQHRQWDAGIQDYEALRQAYQRVSIPSQRTAQERGTSDQYVAERIRQLEELEKSSEAVLDRSQRRRQQMQQHRRSSINSSILLLAKSKSLLNKSVKAAGKVARETGKRGARAGVGAFTLDPRMLLESIKIEKKKREAKASKERVIFKQPSAAGLQYAFEDEEVGAESNFGNSSASVGDDNSIRRGSVSVSSSSADEPHIREQHPTIVQDQSTRNKIDVVIEQKRERLKLLGLVPIPGTKKMYDEDRREKKIESRKKDSKLSGYASWEAGLAAGGKL